MLDLLICLCHVMIRFILFLVFGSLAFKIIKKKMDLPYALFIGFFIYYGLFQLVTLPVTLAQQPLTMLTIIWTVTCALLTIAAVIFCGKSWLKSVKYALKNINFRSPYFYLACIIIIFQIILVYKNQFDNMDAVYYAGNVTTSVQTNTINLYNPYTGAKLSQFNTRYFLSTYPINDAVFSQLTGLHPLFMVKSVMNVTVILLCNLLCYKMGILLFKKDKEKAYLMVLLTFFINIFNHTMYTSSEFLLLRTYEGKTVLANIIIPFVFLVFIKMVQKQDNKLNWITFFCIAWSSCSITMSAMLVVPVAICSFVFPLILIRREWKSIFKLTVCMVPCVLILFYYFMVTKGGLVIPIH